MGRPKLYPDLSVPKLMEYVDVTASGCWEWNRNRDALGYGRAGSDRAYRRAYADNVGPTNGLMVCHHCDNPPCCNPDHLFLGTSSDNNKDRASKGRTVTQHGESQHMAKLTDDDVRQIRCLLALGMNCPAVARMFQVTRGTVNFIQRGLTWKHTMEKT